mmetsp:Transcript_5437/g.9175  ORF Transcript_5437/g.9175 Transcript_5437/m.9175 type:complete len:203 (-) Transcript_5437:52-660(-)
MHGLIQQIINLNSDESTGPGTENEDEADENECCEEQESYEACKEMLERLHQHERDEKMKSIKEQRSKNNLDVQSLEANLDMNSNQNNLGSMYMSDPMKLLEELKTSEFQNHSSGSDARSNQSSDPDQKFEGKSPKKIFLSPAQPKEEESKQGKGPGKNRVCHQVKQKVEGLNWPKEKARSRLLGSTWFQGRTGFVVNKVTSP